MRNEDYRIFPTDFITMRILSNEGFKMVDLSPTNNTSLMISSVDITVELDGSVKLPLIGRINLQGMRLREAEQILETRYAEYYIGPFVTMRVTNKRVAVFPGNAGLARMIPIVNNNTTIIEALALAGGVSEDGKAFKVKLVRRNGTEFKVYLMDLSTIKGLRDGTAVVQANDLIYIEPQNRYFLRIMTQVYPYVSVLSTAYLFYTIFHHP